MPSPRAPRHPCTLHWGRCPFGLSFLSLCSYSPPPVPSTPPCTLPLTRCASVFQPCLSVVLSSPIHFLYRFESVSWESVWLYCEYAEYLILMPTCVGRLSPSRLRPHCTKINRGVRVATVHYHTRGAACTAAPDPAPLLPTHQPPSCATRDCCTANSYNQRQAPSAGLVVFLLLCVCGFAQRRTIAPTAWREPIGTVPHLMCFLCVSL